MAEKRTVRRRTPTLEDVLTPSVVTGGGFPLGGVMEDVDDTLRSGARGLEDLIRGMTPQTPLDFALEFGLPMLPGSGRLASQVGRRWDEVLQALDDTAVGDLYDAILRRLPTSPPPDVIGSHVESITDIGGDLPNRGISRTNQGFNPEARSIQGGSGRPTGLGDPRSDLLAQPRFGPRVPRDQQGWYRRPNPTHIEQLEQDVAQARRRGSDAVTERLRRRQEAGTPGLGPLDRRPVDQPGALPKDLGSIIPESVGAVNPNAMGRMPGFRNRLGPLHSWSDVPLLTPNERQKMGLEFLDGMRWIEREAPYPLDRGYGGRLRDGPRFRRDQHGQLIRKARKPGLGPYTVHPIRRRR
jgi:hypothetical protein